jgi:hypothetical protein
MLSLAAVTPTNVILDAGKRYFCVREHITPTNVIFDLCPLAVARLSEPPAEHKTHVSQDTDKRYFGCQTFGGTNLKVV